MLIGAGGAAVAIEAQCASDGAERLPYLPKTSV